MSIDGEMVATLRKLRGMKVSELASAVNLSESYVRDIESTKARRKLNRGGHIAAFASALGVPERAITIGN